MVTVDFYDITILPSSLWQGLITIYFLYFNFELGRGDHFQEIPRFFIDVNLQNLTNRLYFKKKYVKIINNQEKLPVYT